MFWKKKAVEVAPAKPDFVDEQGFEFWRLVRDAERAGLSQAAFDDFMNNPRFYRMADPNSYREHLEEVTRRAQGVHVDDANLVHFAVLDQKPERLRQYLADGHKVDVPDREGRTALTYAALYGYEWAISELVLWGAKVNWEDFHGDRPLHFAAREFHLGTAKLLLGLGAEVDVADIHGNTPLWRALSSAHQGPEMIHLLIDAGADPDRHNRYGNWPFNAAWDRQDKSAKNAFASYIAKGLPE